MPFHKIYLLIFALFTFSLLSLLRSYILWKRTGINPFRLKKSDDVTDFFSRIIVILTLCVFVTIIVYVFLEKWYPYLLPVWYLEIDELWYAGWLLMHLAVIWIFTSQMQLSDSWRFGIDEENETELITHGVFRFSRNPIFLGVNIANLGLFLVLPNAFTLLFLVLAFVSVNLQVGLEEAFLRKRFGKAYQAYCKKVRRWL